MAPIITTSITTIPKVIAYQKTPGLRANWQRLLFGNTLNLAMTNKNLFALILFTAIKVTFYTTTAHAQLNEFKENKARIDKDRQLLIKNKLKERDKYWMRIRLGKLTGDSTLVFKYYY